MRHLKRVCPPGEVFHVLNRAVARMTIFAKPEDYDAVLRVVEETWRTIPLPNFAPKRRRSKVSRIETWSRFSPDDRAFNDALRDYLHERFPAPAPWEAADAGRLGAWSKEAVARGV